MKLNELRPIKQKTFQGTYRLTGRVVDFDDEGIAYVKLRLSRDNNDCRVLAVPDTITIPDGLKPMELVSVKGQVCIGPQESEIILTDIRRPITAEVLRLPALQTLPKSFCPRPEALEELTHIVRAMKSAHLQSFLKRVLERRDRLAVFLQAPASQRYHHNYPGGLLVHSLEVAKGVLTMVQMNEPEASQGLQELGFVAGLLHDIGKIQTCDTKGRPTAAARLCDHADLTLEVCALGLAYLDRMDPDSALALRHIWTCASPGARYGKSPYMTLARYVRDADGQSAMADNQRKAYQNRKQQGFGRLGQNNYWLPTLQAH